MIQAKQQDLTRQLAVEQDRVNRLQGERDRLQASLLSHKERERERDIQREKERQNERKKIRELEKERDTEKQRLVSWQDTKWVYLGLLQHLYFVLCSDTYNNDLNLVQDKVNPNTPVSFMSCMVQG